MENALFQPGCYVCQGQPLLFEALCITRGCWPSKTMKMCLGCYEKRLCCCWIVHNHVVSLPARAIAGKQRCALALHGVTSAAGSG